MKILIVDDEEDIRSLVKEVLEGAGFDVDQAIGGKECLVMMRNTEYDLVLIDMFMPGMSGRETYDHIRADKNVNKAKVAFLTVADLGEKGRTELKFLGAVDYINKPIANKELIARVKKILKR